MSGSLRVPAFLRRILSVIFVGAMVLSPRTRHLLPVNIVWLLPRNLSRVLSPHLGLVDFVAVPLTVHLTHACQTARQHTLRFRFRLSAPTEDHVAGPLVFPRAILVQRLSLIASSHSGSTLSRGLDQLNLMHQMTTRLCLCLLLRYLRQLLPSQYLFWVLLNASRLHLNPFPSGVARRCLLPLRYTLRSVRMRSIQASLLLFLAHHPHTRPTSTLLHRLRHSTPSLNPLVT